MPSLECIKRDCDPSPNIRPELLLCLLLSAELERRQLSVKQLEARNPLVAQFTSVEEEGEQVIPRPMWRYPINAE